MATGRRVVGVCTLLAAAVAGTRSAADDGVPPPWPHRPVARVGARVAAGPGLAPPAARPPTDVPAPADPAPPTDVPAPAPPVAGAGGAESDRGRPATARPVRPVRPTPTAPARPAPSPVRPAPVRTETARPADGVPLIGPTETGTAPVVVPRWDPAACPAATVRPVPVRPVPVGDGGRGARGSGTAAAPAAVPATRASPGNTAPSTRRPAYVPAVGCDLFRPDDTNEAAVCDTPPAGGAAAVGTRGARRTAGIPGAGVPGAGSVAAIPGYSANFVGFPVGRTPRGVDTSRLVRLDTPTSAPLLDFQNRQTDKQLLLLANLPNQPGYPSVVPAAQLRVSALAARTNTPGKFGYLGRFPPDFRGEHATDVRVLQANLAAHGYFAPWAAGYVETLFSDVFSFPTFDQGSFQVRQAYAVFGDPLRTPWYAVVGKKTVSFGDFSTLSPFTQAVPWHYFAALGEQAGVGYVDGGFHAVVSGINGGRGQRVVDSDEAGDVNNFAVNLSYARRVGVTSLGPVDVLVGGGYLDGTIYDSDTPEHTNRNQFGPKNGAWDVNGTVRVGRAIFAGEYVSTVDPWPVTGVEVSAYKLEGAYDLPVSLLTAAPAPLRLSVSFSEGVQGPSGSEFERNAQLVLGAGYRVRPNVLLSAEYVRSIGFAPLIGLTAPGVSERDARQDSLVLGASLVL